MRTKCVGIAGGWLGLGNDPRYSKSRVFDPFPFPFPDPPESMKVQIREVAEELDALRKQVQSGHGVSGSLILRSPRSGRLEGRGAASQGFGSVPRPSRRGFGRSLRVRAR